ncbi:MAG: glycosyltransferase [Patescibacteria group bacterium]|nr:glycosyltransferase [Patescibacteria group bacterium]
MPLAHKIKLLNWYKFIILKKQFKPDKIFFSAGLDALPKIKVDVFFSGVPFSTLSQTERKIGQNAKLVITNDSSHNLAWGNLATTLPISAVAKKYFKPAKKTSLAVSFVGTLSSHRQQTLARIGQKIKALKVWGWLPPGTKLNLHLKPFYQGEAWGKKVADIFAQSQISLNLGPDHMTKGGNLRSFEITGSQTLLLTDQLNPDWFLAGKEAIKFSSIQEAIRKINYYLSHPKALKAIASAGYLKTIHHHTYKHRFKKLLSLI